MIIPTRLEKNVVTKIGTNTSVLPLNNSNPFPSANLLSVLYLNAKIEIGIRVKPEVFKTKNII